MRTIEEALDFLFARTTGGFKFGLERTYTLLDALGNPQQRYPVIHVAGTNGKGSSMATAEALLLSRGLRVGKYTSPHLVDFGERILVDRVPIDGQDVVAFVDTWTPLVEQIGATFFEATTAMAFDAFAKANVDIALIETGLGGRLDSTNVVDPISAGVTSIGWDHMEYLGHSLETIAGEKAGIFKPGRPAVIGEGNPDIRDLLRERASAAGATPFVVAEEILVDDVHVSAEGTHATFEMFGERERLGTPLIGRHQAQNLAFTLGLLHTAGPQFRFSLRDAREPLATVVLPGRFQRVGRFILDVAHNADGMRVLADTLRAVRPPRPILGVFCALRDKEWEEMLSILSREVDALVLTHAPTAPQNRAWDLDIVRGFVERMGIPATLEPHFDTAIRSTGHAATVVVAGSFHTVGDAMARGLITAG